MKNTLKYYTAVWAVMLVIFNALCFLTPNGNDEFTKFGGAFWIGYIFITIAFAGQLACAWFAFKDNSAQRLFYRLPLISISYTGLILTLVFGGIAMVVPDLPKWIGALVCMVILAFCVTAVINSAAAADAVEQVDVNVAARTSVIRILTADAQSLMAYANDPQIQADCEKVYEAARYSDPVSSPALAEVENRLTQEMRRFSDHVKTNDADSANSSAELILKIVNERNIKCKLTKN